MIKNAKIVAVNAHSKDYHTQKVEDRGKPDYVMSSSDLRLFAPCPSKWKNGYELPASQSLEYGSLLDCLVLTPERFEETYALIPSTYKKTVLKCPKCGSVTESPTCRKCKCEREEATEENPWSAKSETCQAWIEEQKQAGKEVVSQDDLTEANKAKARLLADEQCKLFLDSCERQVWVKAEWHDEETGLVVPVQCLIDLVARPESPFPKSIGDLKSTKLAAIGAWSSWAHKVGYDIQAAWNTDLFVAASKREITNFCFLLSESAFPYEIGRRYMEQSLDDPQDMGDIASGRRQYRKIMALYCQCVKRGVWPGYDSTDESSATGWTLVVPNPYDEQRRMFAPKIQFNDDTGEPEAAPEDANGDVIP